MPFFSGKLLVFQWEKLAVARCFKEEMEPTLVEAGDSLEALRWHESGYVSDMSTITAILEVDADGSFHLPLPADLPVGKEFRVVATLTPVESESDQKAAHQAAMEALRSITAKGGLGIEDPVAWQREIRKDRPLPGREL